MSRIARLVIPGVPHHVTQRGVRRMCIFDTDADQRSYLRKLSQKARQYGLEILCWCLMPNHVHLVAVPGIESSLASSIGLAHWAYTRYYNDLQEAGGRLFQGRFYSAPLDERHFFAAVRYVLQNPVRAGMIRDAWDYPWSSASFHMHLQSADPLVRDPDVLGAGYDWPAMLSRPVEEAEDIRRCTFDGYPCGSQSFIENVGERVGRDLSRQPVGRPRKSN